MNVTFSKPVIRLLRLTLNNNYCAGCPFEGMSIKFRCALNGEEISVKNRYELRPDWCLLVASEIIVSRIK
jgi:hypothetical protein